MRIVSYWNNVLIFGASFVFLGCANDALPKPQKLGPLRVLGVIAEPPEVSVTSLPVTVSIRPIISDFTLGPRNLNYSWKLCFDPGVAQGASPTCAGATLAAGTGNISAGAAPLDQAPYSGAIAPFNVTIPAGIVGSFTSTQLTNGIPLLYTYDLAVNGGDETTRAFRRIIVTSRTSRNTNVILSSISGLVPNGLIQDFPSSEQPLTPVLGSTADNYTVISSTGETLNRTEKLTVSWFTTDGEFEFSRTDAASSNKWTPPQTGTPRGLVIFRDDRGGMSAPIQVGF